ncbi:hypothetical protein J2S13_000860 [Oikeobacillus pervagus]|uniref:Uncharacterized protein n=1 Tax=Oikeobacillus pervagus TaxID=1325931 RepID=A0AAJ1T1Z7_9BACI|nr:hypothetical protein [Oikeobacillus pervagus]MDQ0214464.1 hypothetical protein [Oikeobacillus pervagus]
MKQISGSQLTPNNLTEECIRVPKVYDWVFDAITTDTGIVLPDDCAAAVALAVSEGRTPLDVTCEVPEVSGFFPLDPLPDPNGNVSCTVSSRIERREIPVNGVLTDLAIVKVIFTIRPLVTILDSEGTILCQFRPTISESRRLVVCAPEPFTSQNVFCRIIDLDCETNFIETGVPDLGLQIALDICFEIQVEADVKLEVLAKFCFPRPNDIPIPGGGVCPPFEWPVQCGPDVFPRPNCDCQAFVDTDPLTTPTGIGITFAASLFEGLALLSGGFTTRLNAEICDNCNLTGSSVEWVVNDLGIGPTGTADQGFTFTATEINMPTCTTIPVTGITTMTVTGTGIVNFVDPSVANRDVTFTLTLVETPAGLLDIYAITLLDLAGAPLITLALGAGFVPDEDLIVQDCLTFPNIITP